MATLPSIEELNQMNDESFKKVVSVLFELAPPLERRLIPKRPFGSYQNLINEGRSQISQMSEQEKRDVLRGHPAIGQKKLKGFSKIEQGTEESEEVFEKLARLNQEYEDYFQFPFVIFVNGRPKSQICEILDKLMNEKESHSPESELNRALEDLFLIAEDRLKKSTIQSSL